MLSYRTPCKLFISENRGLMGGTLVTKIKIISTFHDLLKSKVHHMYMKANYY